MKIPRDCIILRRMEQAGIQNITARKPNMEKVRLLFLPRFGADFCYFPRAQHWSVKQLEGWWEEKGEEGIAVSGVRESENRRTLRRRRRMLRYRCDWGGGLGTCFQRRGECNATKEEIAQRQELDSWKLMWIGPFRRTQATRTERKETGSRQSARRTDIALPQNEEEKEQDAERRGTSNRWWHAVCEKRHLVNYDEGRKTWSW